MPPFILAVETSSRIGSVAIALGEKLLAESLFAGPARHSAELFPAICSLLDRFGKKPDQIEHIYISIGPGSFTGLRIAVTMAKTISLANAAKIVAVDSLDVTVSNVIDLTSTGNEKIAAIADAKRGQFFIAIYQKTQQSQIVNRQPPNVLSGAIVNQPTGYKKIVPDCLMSSDEFLKKFTISEQPIRLLGDGLLYHRGKFEADGVRFFDEQYWSPRASKVHLLGWQSALQNQFTDPLALTPNYLMRPDFKPKST